MNDHEIILAIQNLLSGVEWNASTIEGVAELLTDNGYKIEDCE